MQLHRRFPDEVVCISVSVDYNGSRDEPPESLRERVTEVLAAQQATFTNVLSSDADEVLLQRLGLASVPAVLVYDRTGQLRQRFDNDQGLYGEAGFTYREQIVPLVETLLPSP